MTRELFTQLKIYIFYEERCSCQLLTVLIELQEVTMATWSTRKNTETFKHY